MDGITSQVKYSDFEELKKKVNHLEYEELKEVRGDIQDIKESMAKNDVLLQQNISSSEKLNTTLNNVQNTMIQLAENMKASNAATNSLSQKVSNLENKIDNVENKGKLDMALWFQKKLGKCSYSCRSDFICCFWSIH